MEAGIASAAGVPIDNPLPPSWLGLTGSPMMPPSWATLGVLSSSDIQHLQCQIAYDLSRWDYQKIGPNNRLGRYQFSTQMLEAYGLLAAGSNAAYGTDCVNYTHCWQPISQGSSTSNVDTYFYDSLSLTDFLNNTAAQEHLAYQRIIDIYLTCLGIESILETDPADVVSGMIYVGWSLSPGTSKSPSEPYGSGSWAWRFYGIGNGINSFNSGRYAKTVLGA